MSNPASFSRAERPLRPWYREPWPWLLAAGPLAVIAASVCSAWIAVNSDDGLVAQDYYKRGLLINQKLGHMNANEVKLGATVRVADNGEVRVRMEGMADTMYEAPPSIRLRLAHPTRSAPELVVTLVREANGDYVGMLREQTPGRWIVILESSAWRLPATTIAGRLTEFQLGTATGRS